MPQIAVNIDAADFAKLVIKGRPWADDWCGYADLYEITDRSTEISNQWRYAYWVGPQWMSVMLARGYLDATGFTYQIVEECINDTGLQYVILTDYRNEALFTETSAGTGDPRSTPMPYVHFGYFMSHQQAQAAREELEAADFAVSIVDAVAQGASHRAGDHPWMLYAVRETYPEDLSAQHDDVTEIVRRHAGLYDGGVKELSTEPNEQWRIPSWKD